MKNKILKLISDSPTLKLESFAKSVCEYYPPKTIQSFALTKAQRNDKNEGLNHVTDRLIELDELNCLPDITTECCFDFYLNPNRLTKINGDGSYALSVNGHYINTPLESIRMIGVDDKDGLQIFFSIDYPLSFFLNKPVALLNVPKCVNVPNYPMITYTLATDVDVLIKQLLILMLINDPEVKEHVQKFFSKVGLLDIKNLDNCMNPLMIFGVLNNSHNKEIFEEELI